MYLHHNLLYILKACGQQSPLSSALGRPSQRMGTQYRGKSGVSQQLGAFFFSGMLNLPLKLLPLLSSHEVVWTRYKGNVEGHKDGQNIRPEEGRHCGEGCEGCLCRAADVVTWGNGWHILKVSSNDIGQEFMLPVRTEPPQVGRWSATERLMRMKW